MSTDTSKIFADRLGDLIVESKKTIKTLSQEIGISEGALSKYQNDGAAPSINALAKIAAYFGVSADWLLGLSEFHTKKSEQVLAKDIGLSEQTISVLSTLNYYPHTRGVLRVINKLIEQEQPLPSPSDFILSENDTGIYNRDAQKMLEDELHGVYERACASWRDNDYAQVISKIATFLFLRIDSQKQYWLNTDGSIAPRPSDARWYEDYGAVNTFQSKDIIDQMLFSQIENELKNLRDKLQLDPEWGKDVPITIHNAQVEEADE